MAASRPCAMAALLALALAATACSALTLQGVPVPARVNFNAARLAFADFQHTYSRVYSSAAEHESRFQVFRQNMARAEQQNVGEDEKPFGVSPFSDLTAAEFAATHLMPKSVLASADYAARTASIPVAATHLMNQAIPAEFDWRSKTPAVVSPVKNQGQCGSCWAFSATENIESIYALSGKPIVKLAPQQIVDCDGRDDGCNGGDLPTAWDYVMKKSEGLEPEKDYPYTARTGKCKAKKTDELVQVSGFEYATKDKNETAMEVYLYNKAPLAICVDAEPWQSYNSGIVKRNCGKQLDHCVAITGFGQENGVQYWSIKNSWGESWGEKGYIRVERGKDLCGLAMEAMSTYITKEEN